MSLIGTFPGATTPAALAPKNLISGISTKYESTPPAAMMQEMRGPMM